MVVKMTGSPAPSECTPTLRYESPPSPASEPHDSYPPVPLRVFAVSYGGWDNTPLERFDKFAKQPISAWHVSDGTLSDGSAPDGYPGELWKKQLRTFETNSPTLSHPTWKSTNETVSPIWRQPRMMRLGVSGDVLGPNFHSM